MNEEKLFGDQETDTDDDIYHFADEEQPHSIWKVLIVDDEDAVHKVTKLSLKGYTYEGKRIKFIQAYTAQQAKLLISQHPDTAVILLDLMLHGQRAGLDIVTHIRKELHNPFVRIILRTGQPQEAPEHYVIREFDINDYREKTEVTAEKLFTVMTASLRAYRDIMQIESNKKALERIINSSTTLLEGPSMKKLADRVLGELTEILKLNIIRPRYGLEGFIAVKDTQDEFHVMSATNKYAAHLNQPISRLFSACSLELFKEKGYIGENQYSKFFLSKHGYESFIYFINAGIIDDWEDKLIEILMMNVSVAIDNMYLNKEIEETQKEILFTLGEFSEARSKETSNHVKRVAEYSRLLALKCGLSEEEAELIRLASPMHDVGKLGITDTILNKPGKLNEDEFEIIKSHGTLGYEILKNSNRKIMQAGALIALQHHERYDGTGYPQRLAGNNIHIYGRITAIADVFDALGSDRIYKKAWPLEQILAYFEKECGSHFDPKLVNIFLNSLPEFLAIRDEFSDTSSLALNKL